MDQTVTERPAAPSPSWFQRAVSWLAGARVGVALDGLGALLVLVMPLWLWPRAALPPGVAPDTPLPDAPWWGAWSDRVLDGPDAAEWAVNSQRMAAGAFELLDRHRMPSWLLLVAGAMRSGLDVVTAGHLVNRGMFLGAVLSVYLLARVSSGRLAAVLAATMVVADQHLGLGVQRFGIDAAIEAMLPLGLAVAFLTRERWWLGLPAGLVLGWVALLHQTALPFVVPALWIAAVCGPAGWRRYGGAVLLGVGVCVVFAVIARIFPFPGLAELAQDVNEGAQPGSGSAAGAGARTVSLLQGSFAPGLNDAYVLLWQQMSGWLVPMKYLVPFGVIGVFGPCLDVPRLVPAPVAAAPAAGVDIGGRLLRFGRALAANSAVGLGLAACLAPLPFLAAAHAPTRYGENLLPFAAVLIARGAASVVAVLRRAVAAVWVSDLPAALIRVGGVALGIAAVVATTGLVEARGLTRAQLGEDGISALALGSALRDAFPAGSAVACPMTESLLMAGLEPCRTEVCPVNEADAVVTACVDATIRACAVDGTLGYVALPQRQMYDPKARGRPVMDAFIAARVAPASTVQVGSFTALIYKVPADLLAGMPAPEGPPPAGSPEGPPPAASPEGAPASPPGAPSP